MIEQIAQLHPAAQCALVIFGGFFLLATLGCVTLVGMAVVATWNDSVYQQREYVDEALQDTVRIND